MKKLNLILSIILIIAMVFSFSACNNAVTPTPTPTPTTSKTPTPVTPSPVVTPVPTKTPTPGESLFQPDVPSIKRIDFADISTLTGSGTYYVNPYIVTTGTASSVENTSFTGKLIFNEITSAGDVSIMVASATVDLLKDVNVKTLAIATSQDALTIKDAVVNTDSININGGNVVVENAVINGDFNIAENADTVSIVMKDSYVKSTKISSTQGNPITISIEGDSKTEILNARTSSTEALTTIKVSGTSYVKAENASGNKTELIVTDGSTPNLTVKNSDPDAESFVVTIPQNDKTKPNISLDDTVAVKNENGELLSNITVAPTGVAVVGTGDSAKIFIYEGKAYSVKPTHSTIKNAIGVTAIKTIILGQDINPTEYVNITKPMTIDLNGFTINAGIYFDTGSQGSTIKNGTVDLTGSSPFYSDGLNAPVIYVGCGGTTTIANMTLKSNGLAVDAGIVNGFENDEIIVSNTTIDITSIADDNVNAIYLNSGTLSAPDALYVNLVAKTDFNTFGVAYANGAEVTSLKSIQPTTSTNNPTAHLRAYYLANTEAETAAIAHAKTLLGENQIFAISNADGTTLYQGDTVLVTHVTTVAGLKKALLVDGTVKLASNLTLSDTDDALVINKATTLDLNGFTISGKAYKTVEGVYHARSVLKITATGNLTLTSTNQKNGKILIDAIGEELIKDGDKTNNYTTLAMINNRGTLTVKNVLVRTNTKVYFAIATWGASTLNIEDKAAIYGNAGDTDGCAIATHGTKTNEGWTINIKDGSIVKGNEQAMYLPSAGTLNIYGGTIIGKARGVEMRAGTINMTGGTITADSARKPSATTNGGSAGAINGALVLVKSKYTTETGYNGAIVANLTGGTLSNSTANGDALVIVKEVKTSGSHPSDSTITVTNSGTTITGGTYTAGEDITITPPQT